MDNVAEFFKLIEHQSLMQYILKKYNIVLNYDIDHNHDDDVYNIFVLEDLTKYDENTNNICIVKLICDYYLFKQDINNYLKYLIIGAKLNIPSCVDDLIVYYKNRDEVLAIKYIKQAIELGEIKMCYILGYHYNLKEYYEIGSKSDSDCCYMFCTMHWNDMDSNTLINYYLKAIELNNFHFISITNAYHNLASLYLSTKNYDLMKLYFEKSIEGGNAISCYSLMKYYTYYDFNIELIEKYHILAFNTDIPEDATTNIDYYDIPFKIALYLKNSNLDEFFRYRIIFIDYNDDLEYDYVKLLSYSNLDHELFMYELYDNYILSELALKYNDKVKKSTLIEECVVCFNNKKIIEYDCGHKICEKCYLKLSKCHLCRSLTGIVKYIVNFNNTQ